MAERPHRKPPAPPADPIDRALSMVGARKPDVDETAAIRALMRGYADRGQQIRAISYMMVELCHVGSVPFSGENVQGTAFRAGQLAVGIMMAQIADAVLMRFPSHSEPVQGDDATQSP